MKRIFRVRGQRRFYGFCCLIFFVVMLVLLHLGRIQGVPPDLGELLFFDFLCLASSVAVLLEIFVIRVEADERGVCSFDMLNRKRADLAYEEITSYVKDSPGGWTIRSAAAVLRIGKIDKHEFHAVIAEKAAGALNAKLWRCGQLPPSEEFTALSLFDWNIWLTNTVGAALLSGVVAIFSRGYALGYFVSSLLQTSYHLKDLFGRLDVTSDGLQVRWPWAERSILWTELTAVFCERSPDRSSYFVVTAPGRSITVPAHVLADPEVRRKFFYNIPDMTRCVNFDKLRFRRRGRGKKVFGEDALGSLDPLMSGS